MTTFANRNVLLLAAVVAVAAGVFYFESRSTAPVAESTRSEDRHASSLSHFATVRSSHQHHASGEESQTQRQERTWREALDSADRCSAMARSVSTSALAQQAMAWARSIEDEVERKMAVDAVLCAWTKFDAHAAVNWALNVADDASARSFAITSVFESWAALDPKAASDCALTLGQADQTYAIAAVAPALTARDAQSAIQWAQEFDEEDARNLATHAVVTAWAANAPSDAAAWVATEPDGFESADDVRTVVQKWLETDVNAAIAWVGKLPAGTSRDGALDLIANQLADSNPSLAAQWGEAIDRMELRDARLESIAGKWLNTDPNGARRWLEKAPLSEQAKLDLSAPKSGALR